ncbi:MAG: hypothetical protein M1822_003128 [Bathelium mastoideum]|nr:MAG: hypothetical protein M1822_003128 [Bathelium mastoideum]
MAHVGSESPLDEEKKLDIDNGQFENVSGLDLPSDPDAHLTEADRIKIEKRLVRKLDLRLIPWLSFLYLVCFLDRTNIGNAKVEGLSDIMTPGQYNAALTLFFISYALLEPLTNVLLKRLRPSIFIPAIMLLWGIVMVTMGLIHDFSGLAAARFFLGVAEAGLFPGINYYLSCWYKRSEFGIRAAIFFSAAALAGSFGGLLAAAISLMDGIGGKPGWAWIFILEGLATVVIAVISYWMVFDFPDEATFLSDDDRARVVRRLKLDGQSSAEHEDFKMQYLWAAVRDWKTWVFAVIYMGADMPLYAFSLFLPTIIAGLGYDGIKANLLSVPPYAAAAVMTVAVGWYADRTRRRGLCNIVISFLAIAGFGMLIGSKRPGVQYAGTFLGGIGIYPVLPNTIAWASNNAEGVYKRGISLGILIGWGNLNGVVSSNIFLARQKPRYYTGHGVIIAYLTLFQLGFSILAHILLRRENNKRRSGKRDHWVEGKSEQEIEILGDKRPDFIYTT